MIIVFMHNERVFKLFPNPDMDATEVARKDVPAGSPFRLMDAADLPADLQTIAFDNPDGIGEGQPLIMPSDGL